MRKTLTIEQSAELIKRGVSKAKASGTYVGRWEHSSEGSFPDPESVEPLFTLTDLLSLVPKEIKNGLYNLDILADNREWFIHYASYHNGYDPIYICHEKELVDAIYKTILWAIDHNHVKLG